MPKPAANGDVQALRRLEQVFGRVQSPWLPASGDETYEIIRRRLFQPLDADGEKARDETVKAFHDLYRKNPAEFPPEAKEARYLELLRLSYPIHPELFDRLSKDWASLEKFQRTRGVLRFMANVIGVLWHAQTRDPLITPARVPVAHERVRASVLYPLDPAFGAVVDREVDGDGSLPARMEANPSRRISQLRAATRAARAVFLCTAPLVGQPNAGTDGPGAAARLRRAGRPARDLRRGPARADRARDLSLRGSWALLVLHAADAQPAGGRSREGVSRARGRTRKSSKVLGEDAKIKGSFYRVFAAPDDPTSIEEAEALSLVILSPSMPHSGKGALKSPATDGASDALMRCRASQRRLRNTLLFRGAR